MEIRIYPNVIASNMCAAYHILYVQKLIDSTGKILFLWTYCDQKGSLCSEKRVEMDDFVAYMKPVLITLYVIMTKMIKVKPTEDITNDIVRSPLCVRTSVTKHRRSSLSKGLVWNQPSAQTPRTVYTKYAKTTAAELDLG
jgi:hypothetical protein